MRRVWTRGRAIFAWDRVTLKVRYAAECIAFNFSSWRRSLMTCITLSISILNIPLPHANVFPMLFHYPKIEVLNVYRCNIRGTLEHECKEMSYQNVSKATGNRTAQVPSLMPTSTQYSALFMRT